MKEDMLVKVDDIVIPKKRMRTSNHIEELAESIREIGLLQSIVLRKDGDQLILVAGMRRLQATKLLRYDQIRARVLDMNEVDALLVEIDENLQRAELLALERAQHIAERKRVWESKHPQTKHGGTPGKKGGKGGKAPRDSKAADSASLPFADDTENKTGIAARTVQVDVQIGEKICRKAQELLTGTPVADRKTDLLRIAQLKDEDGKPDHKKQVAVARVIKEGKANNYPKAKRLVEADRIKKEPPPLPAGPFRVIVADPPWSYEKRENDASKREQIDYATMTLEEIREMPVKELADKNAVLWLWSTNAHLPEAFGVAAAWGFTYKVMLTWNKKRIGMGEWLRGQTEHCLLCVRGKPTVTLAGQSTLIEEARDKHSVKPEAFYKLVESLCPGSKVELFARRPRDGWQSWGSEQAPKEEA